jgi:hypothetical protein
MNPLNEMRIAERIVASFGLAAPGGPKPKFKHGDKVVVEGLPGYTDVWAIGDYDEHLGDRRYVVINPKTRHRLNTNEKGMKKASERQAVLSANRDLGYTVWFGKQHKDVYVKTREEAKQKGAKALGTTSDKVRVELFDTNPHGMKKASERQAGAGMPQSEFLSKVRRIMQKVAARYGGRANGQVASGVTDDGVVWSATITRTTASNGETFGRLDITANGKLFSGYTDWNDLFAKAGINLMNPAIHL